ncbi:MAG: UDP-N-acetylmuramate dehydrogenase [Bacillota bacterium]|nr:UDP-N-acetylmuramate dehydrogenase [Bacillota bacterium]
MIYEKLINNIGKDKVLKNVPLREHVSFRVGGLCDFMVFPSSAEETAAAAEICRAENTPYYILGNGTNVIAPDEGYRGTVIKIGKNFSGIRCEENRIFAQAGALLSAVSNTALDNSLEGLEFAGGIPGSTGGGIIMNAGAYGGELKDVVEKVTVLDKNGKIRTVSREKCEFAYRSSAFQKSGDIVLEAEFSLNPGVREEILGKMKDFSRRRAEKQPLSFPSAGSTFKRPEGYFAGKLIEDSGLKGICVGGAQVSELHAGFVINRGGATASDILELIELVRNTVYDRFKVMLQPEVRVMK